MKLSAMIRNKKGEGYITALIILFIVNMMLVLGMAVTSAIIKYTTVKQYVKKAIVTCEVENLDKQYISLIEGDCYDDTANYSSAAYTSPFFSALESSFKTISKEDSEITVYNQSGQSAFTINDLQLSIAVADITMPDTKTKRLVYKATGTLVIPLSVFGYSSSISVPIKVTASFQNTV